MTKFASIQARDGDDGKRAPIHGDGHSCNTWGECIIFHGLAGKREWDGWAIYRKGYFFVIAYCPYCGGLLPTPELHEGLATKSPQWTSADDEISRSQVSGANHAPVATVIRNAVAHYAPFNCQYAKHGDVQVGIPSAVTCHHCKARLENGYNIGGKAYPTTRVEPKWTSVSEALPNDCELVLVKLVGVEDNVIALANCYRRDRNNWLVQPVGSAHFWTRSMVAEWRAI